MTIASAILPTASPRTHAHRSAISSGHMALQAFTTTGQAKISTVQVAGFAGETAMRVLVVSQVDGKPSQVAHSRVGLTPVVSGPEGYVYDLTFDAFVLPPGTFYLSVQGETMPWSWFGTAIAAGYPSSNELTFSIDDTTPTVGAGQRWYRAGQDAFGWAYGQIGTPGSEWNQGAAHKEIDPESADIIAQLDANWSGDFMQIGMGKNKSTNEHFVGSIVEVDNATPEFDFMPRTRALEALKTGAITLPEDFHLDPHGNRQPVRWPTTGRLDGVGGAAVIQNENGVEPVLEPGGDAHTYTLNRDTGEAQETYKIDGVGGPMGFGAGEFAAGVHRRYDLTQEIADYGDDDCCTSANARGGAYIPFLFEADDIIEAAGESLNHCLAFTQNNAYTRSDEYWGEATHIPFSLRSPGHASAGNAAHGMPYGAHLRLKASFVINPAWPPALRSILRTLQLYGMKHVDGSNPGQLVASNDRYATVGNGWDNVAVGMNPSDLRSVAGVTWLDFDVLVPANGEKKNIQDCECRRIPPTPEFRTW